MKNYSVFIITVFAILIHTSCNQLSKEEQEFDIKMQEVIAVHDEVMPKMGEIGSLIKELESKIDTTSQGRQFVLAQKNLKDSYNFMMEWMGDFSNKFPHGEKITAEDKEKFDLKMKTLLEEKVEIDQLKVQMNSSISKAKELLQKS